MRILITGGMGYVGGRLSQALAANPEFEVLVGSRREVSDRLEWLPSAARPVTTQWDSRTALEQLCEGVDVVIHLAAMNAADCGNDPVAALQFNGVVATQLLEAAIVKGVSRFIYLSTAHVYGAPLQGEINESDCPQPLHPYATTHRAAEQMVIAAHKSGRIEGVVLRLSNSFGAPVHPEANCWMLLVTDLCRQAVEQQALVLHSSGPQRRDFVPMRDVCRAMKHIVTLSAQQLGEGLFNIGGEWSPTVLEVAQLIQQRYSLLFDGEVSLTRKEPSQNEQSMPLNYRIDHLKQSGFALQATAKEEIDQLLLFCKEHFD